MKIKVGMLLRHSKTGGTAIIVDETRDDRDIHWWWILDSEGFHYRESNDWLKNYIHKGVWEIVQEVSA